MIGYRHVDPRFPFLWEAADQPGARWHEQGEGPVHYFADTPDGAWAEFIRHEEIRDPQDLGGVRRALWAVEIPEVPTTVPKLERATLTGGRDSYPACRAEAHRLRGRGARGLTAPSAALLDGQAQGWRVSRGYQPGPRRDGRVIVLFGERPDLVGWAAVHEGRPEDRLLPRVRHFRA